MNNQRSCIRCGMKYSLTETRQLTAGKPFERMYCVRCAENLPVNPVIEEQPINTHEFTVENVLREFMQDIEAAGIEQTADEWPDLVVTYNRARIALKKSTL